MVMLMMLHDAHNYYNIFERKITENDTRKRYIFALSSCEMIKL